MIDAGDSVPGFVAGPSTVPRITARLASPPGVLVITGSFWPGTSGKRRRVVARNELAVNDVVVRGVPDREGVYWYVHEQPLDRSVRQARLTLPLLQGVAPPASELLPGIARDSLTRADVVGRALTLRMARDTVPTMLPQRYSRWFATLGTGNDMLQVNGSGAVPQPLEVVLPRTVPLPLGIRLVHDASLFREGSQVAGSDPVRLLLTFRSTLLFSGTRPAGAGMP